MTRQRHVLSLQLLAIALVATSGHAQSSPSRPSPAVPDSVQLLGTDLVDEADTARGADPDVISPFAVSSSGRVVPRERREVTVIGADPAIAEALARREREAESRREAGLSSRPTESPSRAAREREAEARPRPRVHEVERGETWYEIATRYGISPQALERANPGVEPGRMRVGQLLQIPGGSGDAPRGIFHRVEAGETLWAIARRYDVSPESIREANDLGDERLRPDQMLVIPILR